MVQAQNTNVTRLHNKKSVFKEVKGHFIHSEDSSSKKK